MLIFIVMFFAVGCSTNKVLLQGSAEEQFSDAKKSYDDERYVRAIDGFQKTIFNFPGATIVDTAQYYLAMSYYLSEDYELGAVEFSRLVRNYPRSDFADDAQYMFGACYMESTPGHYGLDQGDLLKAISAFEDFIIDNPNSDLIDEAKAKIKEAQTKLAHKAFENGMTYFKMYAYEASTVYFQLVIDDYTNTRYAPLALYRLGEADYKLKNYEDSQEKFNQFIGLYPEHELMPKVNEYLDKLAVKISDQDVAAETE